MQKLFNRCPSCGGRIVITECRCANCQLQMRGEFQTGQFAALSDDEVEFIKVFLSARGNLSEVERVLGISYPTIRNKLDEINSIINPDGEVADSPPKKSDDGPANTGKSRKDILQQVADGQLSPSEAVQRLQEFQEES